MSSFDREKNIEKDALEAGKLALETRVLERQLSLQGVLVAWLQSASVPVTLLGAILAFFVGFGQLHQGERNQAAERFDKSLTRLASPQPNERMTGVAGLQLFLRDGDRLLQKEAMQFLINGLSMETDTRVGGAILDVLADLPKGVPSQDSIDEAIRTAVERDRSLTKSIVDSARKPPMPAQAIKALTTEQYLAALDVEKGPFDGLDSTALVPLNNLRTAIQTLLAHGAKTTDFRQIYCEDCNFRAAKLLDGSNFEGAYLSGADFAHVSLRGSSFEDADLGGTNFFGADLTSANLRAIGTLHHEVSNKGSLQQLPLLECAKL